MNIFDARMYFSDESFSMHLVQMLFSSKYRKDYTKSRQDFEEIVRNLKKPRGAAKSAALGAETRQRVFSVIETVEAELNQLAVVIAQDTGVLMMHPKLIEEVRKHPDREIIEHALTLCFSTPAASRLLNENWPATVYKYKSLLNTEDVLREKAMIFAAYVTNNLDAGTTEIRAHLDIYAPEISEEQTQNQEGLVRLEEAACWYRIIDELAYRLLPDEQRSLFMDHFEDHLANLLALQGASPDVLSQTLAKRTNEYGDYRKWIPEKDEGTKGTLLWEAAKHVGEPFGYRASGNPIFLMKFGVRFLERLERALVHELLTGPRGQALANPNPKLTSPGGPDWLRLDNRPTQ
jgi:hypothetical protein